MKFVQRPLLSQSLQFKQFLSPQLIQKFNILQHSFSELEHAISEMLTENVMIESNSTESLHSVSFKQGDISETSSTLHDNITLKEYLVKQHQDNIPYMKLIKKCFDPNNIMNPGKIFD